MARSKSSSQSCWLIKKRLCTAYKSQTQTSQKSLYFKFIQQQNQRKCFKFGCGGPNSQKGNTSGQKANNSGILLSSISCSKTATKMAPSDRFISVKSPSVDPHVQDGDSGNNKKFPEKRRVALLDRYSRRLPTCTYAPKVLQIPEISDKTRSVSLQISPFRHSYCSPRIHHSSQRGKTSSQSSRDLHAPISRRLASQRSNKRAMLSRYTQTSGSCSEIRLDSEFREVGTQTLSKFDLFGLQIRPQKRQSSTFRQETSKTTKSHLLVQAKPLHNPQKAHGSNRALGLSGEDSPSRKAPYETLSMVPQKLLAIPRILREQNPNHPRHPETPKVVGIRRKSIKRLSTAPIRASDPDFYRCFKDRVGGPSRSKVHVRELDSKRVSATYQYFRAQSSIPSSKGLSGCLGGQTNTHMYRQLKRGFLHKQTRWNKVLEHGSTRLENLLLDKPKGSPDKGEACSGKPKCDSRLPIQERLYHKNRVEPTPKSLSGDMSNMAHTSSGHVCHIPEQEIAKVHLSCARQQSLADRCTQPILGSPGRICISSNTYPPPGDPEDEHISLHNDPGSPRMARDVMVLGADRASNSTTSKTPSHRKSSKTATLKQISHKPRTSEPSCLAPKLKDKKSPGFSTEVESRIKAPQRPSSRKVYTSRWTLFSKWCDTNKVDIKKPSVAQIADFLLYLFKDKQLKPSTIAGYRIAIADGLGTYGSSISNSRELSRLISSFHRDRPKIDTHIPPWDLSLVLTALTKAPFEPLEETSMKHLTLKTVFLLALASGKRRSEIHSWLFKSILFNSDDSKVTVSPSPAFLAKNQLASEGPSSIQPVVIPALSPLLAPDLTEDRSLCPLRCLKIYLDRTKDLRQGKDLIFISFKKGFSKDISKATISQWIKTTVKLAYEQADQELLQLKKVKAHDVRSLAASLAFKGGVPLDDLLVSCYWRSHGTFTNFYLKDICWHNDKVFTLGPIVAAQHIINKYVLHH